MIKSFIIEKSERNNINREMKLHGTDKEHLLHISETNTYYTIWYDHPELEEDRVKREMTEEKQAKIDAMAAEEAEEAKLAKEHKLNDPLDFRR
jgi:hypothetical protein